MIGKKDVCPYCSEKVAMSCKTRAPLLLLPAPRMKRTHVCPDAIAPRGSSCMHVCGTSAAMREYPVGLACNNRAQVQLQTMFRNPWETQSLVWANLLDALRYLVVWNPLRAQPARICRRALPSEPDRCRRAHLRREIAGVCSSERGVPLLALL